MDAMKILFVTDHVILSPNRATLHFTAIEASRAGHSVTVLTTGLSFLSILRRDYRLRYYKLFNQSVDYHGIKSLIQWSIIHPQNLKSSALNSLARQLMSGYHINPTLDRHLGDSFDRIVVESGVSVSIYPELKRRYPAAKFTYLVNDDVLTLRMHPIVIESDRYMHADCDDVVICAPLLAERYTKGRLVEHGIDRDAFDKVYSSPYTDGRQSIVSIGTMLNDDDLLTSLAETLSDCDIHVIGPRPRSNVPVNLIMHGRLPFERTIPFIQHADVGLAPYKWRPNSEYLAESSLKIKQYEYCGIPVVCPDFAVGRYSQRIGYRAGNLNSARDAINTALSVGRSPTGLGARGWDEITALILDDSNGI